MHWNLMTIAQKTRCQVADAVAEQLRGGENLCKETLEDCESESDVDELKEELKRILSWLRA